MARRVTPEEIVEMHRLYAKYGNYAKVGRQSGVAVQCFKVCTND